MDKATGIADARIKLDHIHWYVPHYTPSLQQHGRLIKQYLSKTPTDFRYIERSVFSEDVSNQNLWNFKLGSQESMNVPIGITIGVEQRDRQDSQDLNADTFCRVLGTNAQCVFGSKKHTDAGILLNYDDDDYSQAYGQTEEVFRVLTKDDILKPYISNDNSRSSNIKADDNGFKLNVFAIQYQKILTTAQPYKVEFKFDGFKPNDLNGYALVSANKLVYVSKNGQRHFDIF